MIRTEYTHPLERAKHCLLTFPEQPFLSYSARSLRASPTAQVLLSAWEYRSHLSQEIRNRSRKRANVPYFFGYGGGKTSYVSQSSRETKSSAWTNIYPARIRREDVIQNYDTAAIETEDCAFSLANPNGGQHSKGRPTVRVSSFGGALTALYFNMFCRCPSLLIFCFIFITSRKEEKIFNQIASHVIPWGKKRERSWPSFRLCQHVFAFLRGSKIPSHQQESIQLEKRQGNLFTIPWVS